MGAHTLLEAQEELPKRDQQALKKKMWDAYDDWFKELLDLK